MTSLLPDKDENKIKHINKRVMFIFFLISIGGAILKRKCRSADPSHDVSREAECFSPGISPASPWWPAAGNWSPWSETRTRARASCSAGSENWTRTGNRTSWWWRRTQASPRSRRLSSKMDSTHTHTPPHQNVLKISRFNAPFTCFCQCHLTEGLGGPRGSKVRSVLL